MRLAKYLAASFVTIAATVGAQQYGSWGFDRAGADQSTKPGDDFFRYANGAWLDKTPIPADKPAVSLRLAMTDTAEARQHDLMEEAARAPHETQDLAGKIGAFYTSFMDEARVDALGVQPLDSLLKQIQTANVAGLAQVQGLAAADFPTPLFGLNIDVDLKKPDTYAVYVSQAGLGLPDRDYYLQPSFAAQKATYLGYVAQLLRLAQWPDADASAAAVVNFETDVAQASWTKVQQRDPVATYNPMAVGQLSILAPGFDWAAFLRSAGLAQVTQVVVGEKSAFPKLTAIYAGAPVGTLRAWQAFHVLDNAAPYLSTAFVDASFEFHDHALNGQAAQRARWKRAVTAVGGTDFLAGAGFGVFGTMGFGVGQLYTAKYFPPSSKAKIEALVGNLKAAYHSRIEHLDWMSAATKAEALKKLETYTIKVGYPDHPRDYAPLVVRKDDLIGNVRRAAAFDWHFQTARLFGAVDKSDWGMTPQTNDAYNGSLRDIVFPAGILQAPIFDPAADAAINYGAIGAIIGHELTHGFDDEGRLLDATGALRDWWAPADAKAFEARAKRLSAQYSTFLPLPGAPVNGDLTNGENIADLGGLTLALDAYHASLGGKAAPVLDGFTGDQRVFLGWAQAWRGKLTDDAVRKQVVSDPHSPRRFRVNGVVRNLDAWYAAFGVQPGDKMYVAPADRVRIW
jgi:putative endopeptidase